jgi:hypothetical protein
MDVLNTFNSRFKIFSYRDRHEIPELPGAYAWFFPLHMFDDCKKAQELADCYRKIFALDSLFVGQSTLSEREYTEDRSTKSWQSVSLKTEVHISPSGKLHEGCEGIWDKVQADPQKKEIFRDSLIASSLFMPPLYIGKANDLMQRYNSHMSDSTFKSRFEEFSFSHRINVAVTDLIFCCLSLDNKSEQAMADEVVENSDGNDMNYLLEQILMKSSLPPFSKQ